MKCTYVPRFELWAFKSFSNRKNNNITYSVRYFLYYFLLFSHYSLTLCAYLNLMKQENILSRNHQIPTLQSRDRIKWMSLQLSSQCTTAHHRHSIPYLSFWLNYYQWFVSSPIQQSNSATRHISRWFIQLRDISRLLLSFRSPFFCIQAFPTISHFPLRRISKSDSSLCRVEIVFT